MNREGDGLEPLVIVRYLMESKNPIINVRSLLILGVHCIVFCTQYIEFTN